jgi:hypothetical protein
MKSLVRSHTQISVTVHEQSLPPSQDFFILTWRGRVPWVPQTLINEGVRLGASMPLHAGVCDLLMLLLRWYASRIIFGRVELCACANSTPLNK